MDYKGLIDRHLNVFCGYGVEHLENNITKALINTINSFNHNDLKFFLEKMTGIEFQSDIVKADTFLQKNLM